MGSRVQSVSRLLFKDRQLLSTCTVPGMVKREPARITVGSAATVNALHDTRKSVKKNQAWRYPGGVIQRHTDTRINGRGPYTDDKDPGLPRRKQESNFFITLNTNRSCAGGGDLADVGKEAMRSTLNELSKDRMICQLLKFGPKNEKHYGADWYEDVIQKIEWNAAVELGENLDRLHCHIWLTVHHYSQVQLQDCVNSKLPF